MSQITRRDLIKKFGIAAFLIHPILRSMALASSVPFSKAPRFVMFFKGGSFWPSRVAPPSITNLAGTPIAPLQAHASDIILFKGMKIHGGSPKTDGYQEEHAGGLIGCTTGNSYHYSSNDAYYAYTDHESIDLRIARHYQDDPELSKLPISSLHLGSPISDADNVGLGQKFISFRQRKTGDTRYGNAILPTQNSGQVYDILMQRISLLCSGQSTQPSKDQQLLRASLLRKKSLLDLKLQDLADAKRTFGMDSEHSRKLDSLVEGWRQVEKLTTDQIAAIGGGGGSGGSGKACPTMTRPNGDAYKQNLDTLSPVHDQMISLIQLAFQWDLTRVVAFTLSGESCGQTWPSQGVNSAHHTLEHNGDGASLVKIDTYYSQKFASLLTALKGIDDGGGQTALFNSSVVLGMGCWSNSSSNHYLTDIPFVFAGQGGGRFQTGKIINAGGRNNNDLLISAQNAAGISSTTFGLASLCAGPII